MKKILALALLALVPAVSLVAADEASRQRYAEAFRRFDYPEEVFDELECHDEMDEELCPMHDDTIPCGGVAVVEAFCRELLGEAIVKADEGKGAGKGLNALEGCKTYVSWDDDKAVCCPSDHCWDEEYDSEDDYDEDEELVDDDEFWSGDDEEDIEAEEF
mmetsp:Transcript_17639/g.29326  ORF Transcript_17639/g.29326 Transcript_17639/m.29326 type:complete len:160 (-) Transcript_17639:831-1310(-)